PDDVRLAPETALTLYRAAQEGLTNVQRHARASRVQLTLSRDDGRIALAVQDDGRGPAPVSGHEHGGFGLLGLRERVALLGGRLEFEGVPAGGGRLGGGLAAGAGWWRPRPVRWRPPPVFPSW